MPIITEIGSHSGYPLTAIAPDLAAEISERLAIREVGALSLRLECYLQITGKRLDSSTVRSSQGAEVLQGFIAALFSERFHPTHGGRPWQISRLLRIVAGDSCPPFPTSPRKDSWPGELTRAVQSFEDANLDRERVEFWRGWQSVNLRGKPTSFVLWPVYVRHGRDVCRTLYEAGDAFYRARRASTFSALNEFAQFLGAYEDPIDFESPRDIGRLFRAFFRHFFKTKERAGVELSTASANWREFCLFAQRHLLGHAWAKAIPAIPQPKLKSVPGEKTHIGTSPSGQEVKVSLLTDVPLHITDSSAKELLFSDIERGVEATARWARFEIKEARTRLDTRRLKAKLGTPHEIRPDGLPTGKRALLSRENEQSFAHAAATLEHYGFQPDPNTAALLYPRPLSDTAWELGLATPNLLLAHAAILVAQHPQITTVFLEELELFDKDGQRVGFTETDAGWYLVGKKMRKRPGKAHQEFLLDDEMTAIVRDVIELTTPLREYLKLKGDDRWRRLFLATTSMGSKPTTWNAAAHANRYREWLANRIEIHGGVSASEAQQLAARFSLKRLRNSAAVLVYIRTGSVERMAQALGHERWRPSLLDHYLPKVIQRFFLERWIRLFQTGIICEALKGSVFLLAATHFESMEELNQFLEHHALKCIPAHLADPDGPSKSEADPQSKIVFGIELGILTVLSSLVVAVRESVRQPCGRAYYWARVGELLVNHLETQPEHPEFREMAAAARRAADASKVEGILYG